MQVEFTVRQVTLFFTVYVFFQVWNQINCRSLTPRGVGAARAVRGTRRSWLIAALTVVGQVLIVTFGGAVFKVEPLGVLDWLADRRRRRRRCWCSRRSPRLRRRNGRLTEEATDERGQATSSPRSRRSSGIGKYHRHVFLCIGGDVLHAGGRRWRRGRR